MRFSTVVLTAPRPQSMLKRTIDSLNAGGFSNVMLFDGSPPAGEKSSVKGCTSAYIELFKRFHDSFNLGDEAVLVFEDDVVVCRGLYEHLESCPWPESIDKIAVVSPYCPTAYSNYKLFGKWHREDQRTSLAGTQSFIYPRPVIERMIGFLSPDSKDGVDVQMGRFAKDHELHVWYHVPSLVQHCGIRNSAVGFTEDLGTIYSAETFVGESFDARSLSWT